MKSKGLIWLVVVLVTSINFSLLAEDGGALFKSRCNTCHQIDKNSTGPKLQGAKQKWTDAGEGELLYQWVMNSSTLISSGKSLMANEIQKFSPTAMPAQSVSKEQIDAIFNYIDSYQPPVVVSDTTAIAGALSTESKPDYNYNLSIFNWLLFLTAILIVIIIVLSGTIITLVKSDYFKNKLAEKNNLKNILILILTTGTMFYTNNSFALEFMQAGEAEKGTPWLLVESMDLFGLLTIDIVLLVVVLYLRHLFNQMIAMTKTQKELEVAPPTAEALKKINTILTDAVPIEEEYTILLEHEYDGIQELDNNLPPWWVWGFFATIVFAFIYIINYHVLGVYDLQDDQYNKEMITAKKEIDAYLSKMAMNVDETNATIITEKSNLNFGKGLFETNCASCHKSTGEGDVGPNLTDDHWIYGFDIKDVFLTVKKGRPNGMPEHASKLNPIQIQQVSSYVLSLPYIKGTKGTQGDIIEK